MIRFNLKDLSCEDNYILDRYMNVEGVWSEIVWVIDDIKDEEVLEALRDGFGYTLTRDELIIFETRKEAKDWDY